MNLQAAGGIGSACCSCPHGLRLVLGRDCGNGGGSLQAFLYPRQQVLFPLRHHVFLDGLAVCRDQWHRV